MVILPVGEHGGIVAVEHATQQTLSCLFVHVLLLNNTTQTISSDDSTRLIVYTIKVSLTCVALASKTMSNMNWRSRDRLARKMSSGSSLGSMSTIILSSAILWPMSDEPSSISSSVRGRNRQATYHLFEQYMYMFSSQTIFFQVSCMTDVVCMYNLPQLAALRLRCA